MTSHPNRNTARLEFQKSSSRSPSPNHKQLEECDDARKGDEQLFSGGQWVFRIVHVFLVIIVTLTSVIWLL